MNRIITYPLGEHFIPSLVDHIEQEYIGKGKDLGRLAFVFGGKRPALFLKRELGRRMGRTYYPPAFFSIDEFTAKVVEKKLRLTPVSDIDACALIYRSAQGLAPDILNGRETLARFLPWAYEIVSFIEQLDLENVPNSALKNVQSNAEIGYDVPASINTLLKSIGVLREAFHKELKARQQYSGGLLRLLASELIDETVFDEFDTIFFCNFYYLHQTEKKLITSLHGRKQAVLVFQGDEQDWPVLKENGRAFGAPLRPRPCAKPDFNLRLYTGYDTHSQVSIVRELVKKIDHPENSVLIVPDPEAVLPLLAEVGPVVKDFNVSLGYPLQRSSLFSLLEYIFSAQRSRKQNEQAEYYAKEYLNAVSHPLIKNIRLAPLPLADILTPEPSGLRISPDATRVIVHKIEELLLGVEKSPLGGSLFLKLSAVEESPELYSSAKEALAAVNARLEQKEFQGIVASLHHIMFQSWESVSTFAQLAQALETLIDTLLRYSFLTAYPLNTKAAERLLNIAGEFKTSFLANERFEQEELFRILTERIKNAKVSFSGSPLKGFQMLGSLEARSLSFDNVLIMDMNESLFPNLGISNALIPRDVMLTLGLNRMEKEEEIQRYQFMRLLSSAKNVHLIYSEGAKCEKSRFIEELIWSIQKEAKALVKPQQQKARFDIAIVRKKEQVKKTPVLIEHLRSFRYSATAVDHYLKCPLRFYFRYVLNLQEKEELSDDPEGAEVGRFLHAALQAAYTKLLGQRPVLDEIFHAYFLTVLDNAFHEAFEGKMKSDSFLLKEIIDYRMGRFFAHEAQRADNIREIAGIEKWFEESITLPAGTFRFGARIDRIDRLDDGSLLILDLYAGSARDQLWKCRETSLRQRALPSRATPYAGQ